MGVVGSFVKAQKSLFKYFNSKEEYPVKPMLDYRWAISEKEGINILSYWKDDEPFAHKTEAIIMKKENIIRRSDNTMIVAIDCVKTAFIMNNEYEYS